MSWGLIKDSAIEEYMRTSDQEKYAMLLKDAETHPNVDDEEMYKRVREDDHVIVEWRSFLDLKMKREHKIRDGKLID